LQIANCRARHRSAEALAGDAAISPVATASGKRNVACFRGCNHPLPNALATLADATRHRHPWAQNQYATAKARGHDHQRVIRTPAAPGPASCNAAGKTTPPETPPLTANRKTTPPSSFPTRRGRAST
jgi:hypothetical protein